MAYEWLRDVEEDATGMTCRDCIHAIEPEGFDNVEELAWCFSGGYFTRLGAAVEDCSGFERKPKNWERS